MILSIGCLLLCCQKDGGVQPDLRLPAPGQIGDGWETATPQSAEISNSYLLDMTRFLQTNREHEIHSVLLIRDGKLVYEQYFRGYKYDHNGQNFQSNYIDFHRDTLHVIHSATKSFTSTMVGIAIDDGFIGSVEDNVFDYFPEYPASRHEDMTIEHLLTMTAGFEWNEWELPLDNLDNDLIQMFYVSDPILWVLSRYVIHAPGTTFYYNSGCTNVLGQIVHKTSDYRVDDFAEQFIFEPLGITRFQWNYLPGGLTFCSGSLYLLPRDMAKLGQVFLDGGVWNGQRIVSESWVNAATQTHVQLPHISWADGYGYQWWMKSFHVGSERFEAFSASGWGGQEIFVFSDLDLVCAFNGGDYIGSMSYHPEDMIEDYILPAIE